MIATISKAWPKKAGNNGKTMPGTVVFSDGQKYSTFSDALLQTAQGAIGQLVEYTTEQNGQYTNLASIQPKGAGQAQQQQQPAQPGLRVPFLDHPPVMDPRVYKLLERRVVALEAIAAELKRIAAAGPGNSCWTAPPVQSSAMQSPAVSSSTDVDASQAQLADTVGPDAAEAMFSALKKKHKAPEKLQAAVTELLAAHGIAG